MFLRAYQKLKGTIAMYAFVDYRGEKDTKKSLSLAWEDVFVAFRGYGEETMTGPILQMWTSCPKGQEMAFKISIEEAYSRSVAAEPDYDKRYKDPHRLAAVRDLDDGFHLAAVLPDRSPSLKDWGMDSGLSEQELDEYFSLVDEAVAVIDGTPEENPPPKRRKSRPSLRIVK